MSTQSTGNFAFLSIPQSRWLKCPSTLAAVAASNSSASNSQVKVLSPSVCTTRNTRGQSVKNSARLDSTDFTLVGWPFSFSFSVNVKIVLNGTGCELSASRRFLNSAKKSAGTCRFSLAAPIVAATWRTKSSIVTLISKATRKGMSSACIGVQLFARIVPTTKSV